MYEVLQKKSFEFAVNSLRWKEKLPYKYRELSSQLVKSCTSIGANIRESKRAESTKDWVHKLRIALKEAEESRYWLELLESQRIDCTQELKELDTIIGILVKLTKKY